MPKRALFLALLLALPAAADVLILKDGRKLSGSVKEKPDGYEVIVEGQTVAFPKDEVARHLKSPAELTVDAKKSYEEAKAIYAEAVNIEDGKQAEAKMREALPKVTKAREGYAEARDLFPDGHADLDSSLVNVMKLMRLVREKLGSQIASSGAPAPPVVEAKEEAPPDVAKPPVAEAKPTSSIAEAFAVVVDPARRAEPSVREGARALLKSLAADKKPAADLAMAAYVFLSRDDYEWGLTADVVAGQRGRVVKRSDTLQVLVLADKREVRIEAGAKVDLAQPGEALSTLQEYFKTLDVEKLGESPAAALKLAAKLKELRGKNAPAEPLALFAAGEASVLLGASKGAAAKDLEPAFKDLGWEKSEFGLVWGAKAGLAMDDYRKWMSSGEYGLAVVQFQSDYKGVGDLNVRYAMGLLQVLKALADNRGYTKAASYLELQSRTAPTSASRDHLTALGRSVRLGSPCMACGGSSKVNCTTCRGKVKINIQCGKCGGSGQVNSLRGIVRCTGCNGQGTFKNVDCPHCKATPGKADCKARGCDKPVKPPTFDSFATAYKCGLCKGQGSLFRHAAYSCPECAGIGLILQPKSDPTKLLK